MGNGFNGGKKIKKELSHQHHHLSSSPWPFWLKAQALEKMMYYHEAARKSRVSHLSDATKSQRDYGANPRDRVARKGVHSGPQWSEVATGA